MGADPIHGQKGIANVNRGQQGRCGPVVHRVLGQGLQPAVIDELAARDIRFEYSLHAPLQGREAVRAFAEKFRAAFPDLNFWGTADLIAEGEYVVGQWEGGRRRLRRHALRPATGQHRQGHAVHRRHRPESRERPHHRGGLANRPGLSARWTWASGSASWRVCLWVSRKSWPFCCISCRS